MVKPAKGMTQFNPEKQPKPKVEQAPPPKLRERVSFMARKITR